MSAGSPSSGPVRARRLSASYRLVVVLLKPVLRLVTRRRWSGGENLPRDRGFVAVVNHISYADPITVGLFLLDHGAPPRYLGKEAVFRAPVVGAIVRHAGQIPVLRESSQASHAYSLAVEAVRAGECVAVYPEGTLTRDPDLWPMVGKTGAARVALATGCPVVPVAHWGTHELWPPYGRPRLWPPKTVTVAAGPAVDLSRFADRPLDAATLHEATDAILDALTEQLARIRGERPPAQRWDPRAHGQPVIGRFDRNAPVDPAPDDPPDQAKDSA